MKNILILEDSEIQKKCLLNILEEEDRNIICTSRVQECKDVIKKIKKRIDLLIIDQDLPDGKGLWLVQYIRNLTYTCPIIITSGSLSNLICKNLNKIGIVSFYEKPFEINKLARTVQDVLACSEYYENILFRNSKRIQRLELMLISGK